LRPGTSFFTQHNGWFFARRIFVLAIIGAIISTFCDANHVYTGALNYTQPDFWGQAWWVLPHFIFAFCLLFTGVQLFSRFWFKDSLTKATLASGYLESFVNQVLLFILLYLMTGFAHQNPLLMSAILYLTFLLRLLVSYERRFIFIAAVLMAILGMGFEGTLSAIGLMEYSHPFIYHVPLWLGGLYMHGAFCLRESFRYMVYHSD